MEAHNSSDKPQNRTVPVSALFAEEPYFSGNQEKSKPASSVVQDAKKPPIMRPMLFSPSALTQIKLKKTETPDLNDPSRETVRKQIKFRKCSSEISQIYPHLYVSGDLMAKNEKALGEKNIKTILNLAPSVCKNYFPQKFTYHQMNIIDSTSESDLLWVFLQGIDLIEKCREEKSNCFVHCHQGVSRSGALVIAYVMFKESLGFREAFEMVKSKHSVCSPNVGFMSQLVIFEKWLNRDIEKTSALFAVGRHSSRTQDIVLRHIKSEVSVSTKTTLDSDSPSESEIISLKDFDSRGTFILFTNKTKDSKSPSLFYIWQGQETVKKQKSLLKTLEYVNLLKKYLGFSLETPVLNFPKNQQNADALYFYTKVGVAEAILQNSKQSKYDAMFDFTEAKSGIVDLSTRLKNVQNKDTSKSPSPKSGISVKLFECQVHKGERVFTRLEQFYAEDLNKHGLFVLEKSSSGVNPKVEYFLWLGEDLEHIIHENNALELGKSYITRDLAPKFPKMKLTEDEIKVEKQGEESQEFLVAFESGL